MSSFTVSNGLTGQALHDGSRPCRTRQSVEWRAGTPVWFFRGATTCSNGWTDVVDTVVAIDGEHAVVRSQPLSWDGSPLGLGAEREESVRWSDRGRSLQARLETGEQVSLHWDWVCERLSGDQVDELARCSARQLDVVNACGPTSVRG